MVLLPQLSCRRVIGTNDLSRLKPEMWAPVALELGIPWRAAEAMHWQLGEVDMARRAGVVPFSLAANSSSGGLAAGSVPPNHVVPPAISTALFPPTGVGGPPTPGSHSIGVGSTQPINESSGPRASRATSTPFYRDHGIPIPPRSSFLTPPNPTPGHPMLPSMAELEKGLTASDGDTHILERRT